MCRGSRTQLLAGKPHPWGWRWGGNDENPLSFGCPQAGPRVNPVRPLRAGAQVQRLQGSACGPRPPPRPGPPRAPPAPPRAAPPRPALRRFSPGGRLLSAQSSLHLLSRLQPERAGSAAVGPELGASPETPALGAFTPSRSA